MHNAFMNPLDAQLMETIRAVEERDDSTPVGALFINLFDAVLVGDELQPDQVDMNNPEQVEIWKSYQVLMNKVIYTDSYLRL